MICQRPVYHLFKAHLLIQFSILVLNISSLLNLKFSQQCLEAPTYNSKIILKKKFEGKYADISTEKDFLSCFLLVYVLL